MHVATKSQIGRLVKNGDENMAIKGMLAAHAVNDILEGWGEMPQWKLDNAVGQLRSLLEFIEGGK